MVGCLVSKYELDAIEEETARPFALVPTCSPELAVLARQLRRLAPTSEDLLLVGETGAGKEVYAHAIHRASGRPGPFVALNCAALPRELVESELFGYERGAHSQAVRGKDGLVSVAEGGTLFLDELSEMPREGQAKLLRFVQERSYYRLGGTTLRKAAVRLLAASNRPLTDEGSFGLRRDLAMRFGAEPFVIVPLRDRQGDIATLITHFLRDSSLTVSRPAAELLLRHGWPGNVRELEAVIRRAKHLLEPHERRIEPRHLPRLPPTPSTEKTALAIQSIPSPWKKPRRPAPCREELESLLVTHQGNIAAIARALDRHWRVVYRWVKARREAAQHEISPMRPDIPVAIPAEDCGAGMSESSRQNRG